MWQIVIPVVLISSLVIGVVIASLVREPAATRRWVTIAVLGIAAFPVAIVLHNALSVALGGEEAISFVIALLVSPGLMAVGTLGLALVLVRDARWAEVGASLLVAGWGLAVFALYSLFAIAVTAAAGVNPPIQAAIEAIALSLSAAALAMGAVLAVVTRLRMPATASTAG